MNAGGAGNIDRLRIEGRIFDGDPPVWHLIEAGAGAGKTWTMAVLALHALLRSGSPLVHGAARAGSATFAAPGPPGLLAITFTRRAAAELRDRIRLALSAAVAHFSGCGPVDETLAGIFERIAGDETLSQRELEARARAVLHQIDELQISTIHGFAQRVLREYADLAGLPGDFETLDDEQPLIEALVYEYWSRYICRRPRTGLLAPRDHSAGRPPVDPELLIGVAGKLLDRAGVAGAATPITVVVGTGEDEEDREYPALDLSPTALDELADDEDADASLLAAFPCWFLRTYRRRHQQQPRLSYHDLMIDLGVALRERPDLRAAIAKRWPLLLLDECQDTDPLQWEIFHAIYCAESFAAPGAPGAGAVVMVGDPKQSIYRFRGADLRAYVKERDMIPRSHRYTLRTNYRSGRPVIAAINRLFADDSGNRLGIFDLDEETFVDCPAMASASPDRALKGTRGVWPGIGFVVADDEAREDMPQLTVDRIRALLTEDVMLVDASGDTRPLRPSDIAVLVRSNDEVDSVRAALEEAGIPAAAASRSSVFASHEAAEWLAAWQALLEESPLHLEALTWTRFVRAAVGSLPEALDTIAERVGAVRQQGMVIGALMRSVLQGRLLVNETDDLVTAIVAEPGGLRAWTNYRHLAVLTIEATRQNQWSLQQLVAWLRQKTETDRYGASGTQAAEDAVLQLERDEDAVRVLTVHVAKGLEWPVVLYASAWKAVQRRTSIRYLVAGHESIRVAVKMEKLPAADRLRDDREEWTESMRLLYVALTRASHYAEALFAKPYERVPFREKVPMYVLLAKHSSADPAAAERWHHLKKCRKEEVRQAQREFLAAAVDVLNHDAPPSAPVAVLIAARPTDRRVKTVGATMETPVAPARIALRGPLLRSHSYSSWAHGATAGAQAAVDPVRDLDQDEQEVAEDRFDAFVPGASTGLCWHAILEQVMQDQQLRRDPAPVIEREVAVASVHDRERAIAQLREALPLWLRTPIRDQEAETTLDAFAPGRLFCELRTTLQLGSGGVRLSRLADAAGCVDDWMAAGLRETTRQLNDRTAAGWLEGSIDLLAAGENDEWWVIDYKSDRISGSGATSELQSHMTRRGYLIQTAVYAVAAHRYLTSRGIASPRLHLAWIFLRAFGSGGDAGVCTVPMPGERIAALANVLLTQQEER